MSLRATSSPVETEFYEQRDEVDWSTRSSVPSSQRVKSLRLIVIQKAVTVQCLPSVWIVQRAVLALSI